MGKSMLIATYSTTHHHPQERFFIGYAKLFILGYIYGSYYW